MTIHPIRIDSVGGEYMESVIILNWAVSPGQPVKKGMIVVTVETAKAATDIEAAHDGFLAEIFFDVGEEAPIKAILGTITEEEGEGEPKSNIEPEQHQDKNHRIIASPLARRLSRQSGLDLAHIQGTGPNGRIKSRDLAAALTKKTQTLTKEKQNPERLNMPFLEHKRRLPIVFLHGFGADRLVWAKILPLLPPSFETITLDLPGHGTQAGVKTTSLEDLVFSVCDQLAVLGQERIHLVGHSLGGAVALALASMRGFSIHSMTLLAPAGLGGTIHSGFIKGLVEADSPQILAHWLGQMFRDKHSLPPVYAQAVFREMDKIGNRAVLAFMAEKLFPHGTQIFDLRSDLAKLFIPTRIIWGRDDRILPPPKIEHMPDFVAWHFLSDIGHVPQLENPALTARLISETVLSAG